MGRPRESGLSEAQAKHLAKELRPWLAQYEDNQTEMAKAIGMSQPQLSQILSGRGRGAGVAVLVKIRRFTQTSLDDLLGLQRLVGRAVESAVSDAVDELGPIERSPVKARKRRPRASANG